MKITKKGASAIILFFVLLVAIGFSAKKYAADPLLYTIIGYVILALLSVGAIIFKPFRERLEDFINTNINLPGQKLRILIVGLGRSGKSSIIRHILTEAAPRQEKSTGNFNIYEKKKSLDLENPIDITVSVADYKGQKQSQITNDSYIYPDFFGKRSERLINVLVFVVDPFPELKNSKGEVLADNQLLKRYKKNSKEQVEERVKEHEVYGSQYFIQQVFELTSKKNLFSVKLLINKIDLLREVIACGYLPDVTEKTMEKYSKDLFQNISGDLMEACKQRDVDDFSIHLVSAKKGDNMKLIFGKIFETFHKRRRQ